MLALVIRVASAGLSFASMVMISRWIGAEAYGAFAVMLTLGSFIGLAATLGMPLLVLRVIPQMLSRSEDRPDTALRQFIRTSYKSIFLVGAFFTLILLGLGLQRGDVVMMCAAALILPFALSEHQAHALRGLGIIRAALMPRDIWWYGFITVLGGLGVYTLIPRATAPVAFLIVAAALAVLMILQAKPVLRALRSEDAETPDGTPYKIGWTGETVFLWLTVMASAVQRHLSVVVAAPFLTAVETGAFFAAQRTALLLSLPLIAANLVASPMISRAWSENNPGRVQRLCKAIALAAAVPAIFGLGIIYYAGEWLLALFDPSFVAAVAALYVFAVASLVNAVFGPSGILMLMTGWERPFVMIQIASQLVSLALIALLSASFGLIGAAVGAAFGMIAWNVIVWFWCRRNIGIDPSIAAWIWPCRSN